MPPSHAPASTVVFVRRGRSRPLWHGHPWLFSEAIARIDGTPTDGDEVLVCDHEGRAIGRGLFAAGSQIRVRLYGAPDEGLDRALWHRRIAAALALRKRVLRLPDADTTGYRLVHGEGDRLSGLVIDVFDDVVVVQLGTPGLARRLGELVDVLRECLAPRAIVRAAPPAVARQGGSPMGAEVVDGALDGPVVIRENGLEFECDLIGGQKTGFYFDQRENRARVAGFAPGRAVLDAYSYVGGFALSCARAGAREVVAIDSSSRAIQSLQANARRNGLSVETLHEDVSRALKALAAAGRSFELVILDPPKLAPRADTRDDALRAFRAINALGLSLVKEGLFVTASCAHHVGEVDLMRALAEAAKEAHRTVQVLEVRTQAPDHPVLIACPESRYLTLLLCAVSAA